MNNYEYIIASLPELTPDSKGFDADQIIEEVSELLSEKDNKALSFLLNDEPDQAFYLSAAKNPSRFVREYYAFDLNVRNTKVEYLNESLGREKGLDIVSLPDSEDEVWEEHDKIMEILKGEDILSRERALDDIMWEKIDELTTLHVFDLDVILGFILKIRIVNRWLKLDEQAGRELFRRLVDEIRGSFSLKDAKPIDNK